MRRPPGPASPVPRPRLAATRSAPKSGSTTLARDAGGTLRLNGVKYYSAGSLYADSLFYMALDDEGQVVTVVVPADRHGVTLEDDWDGLAARASPGPAPRGSRTSRSSPTR